MLEAPAVLEAGTTGCGKAWDKLGHGYESREDGETGCALPEPSPLSFADLQAWGLSQQRVTQMPRVRPAEESVVSPVFAECLAGPAGEVCAP